MGRLGFAGSNDLPHPTHCFKARSSAGTRLNRDRAGPSFRTARFAPRGILNGASNIFISIRLCSAGESLFTGERKGFVFLTLGIWRLPNLPYSWDHVNASRARPGP